MDHDYTIFFDEIDSRVQKWAFYQKKIGVCGSVYVQINSFHEGLLMVQRVTATFQPCYIMPPPPSIPTIDVSGVALRRVKTNALLLLLHFFLDFAISLNGLANPVLFGSIQ